MRKHVLDYDDVMNQQRQVIYNRRHDLLERESAHELIEEMIEDLINHVLITYANSEGHAEEWDWEGMQVEFGSTFFLGFTVSEEDRATMPYEELRAHLTQTVRSLPAAP